MVPVVLKKPQKLKILLQRIGEYLVDDIRKNKIWQDWVTGGKYFYFLMETEHLDKYTTQSVFFYPKSPDKWRLKVIQRTAVGYQERFRTIFDFDYLGNEDQCVREFCRLPIWWKMVDAIDNMCQTRLDQNPKYRTIQHEMAKTGELGEKSQEFLDKYYNDPLKKAKHEAWKIRNEERLRKEAELGIVREPKKGRKRRRWLQNQERQKEWAERREQMMRNKEDSAAEFENSEE